MKNFCFVALSGAALLQVTAAACLLCRNDACLKAVALPINNGVNDCSANLFVTVTASARTVTATTTLVESAVATALFTETGVETVSTELLLYTESTTVTASTEIDVLTETTTFTASTETDVLTESTTITASTETDVLTETTSATASTETDVVTELTTVPVTATAVQTAPAVTSTSTVYQFVAKARRSVASDVPAYASTVCPSWDMYISACKCAGAVATTITVPAPAVTVTVPAGSAVTSVVSTLSSTETDILLATATASSTETDIASVTATSSSTEIDVISVTATSSSTEIDVISVTASTSSTETDIIQLTATVSTTQIDIVSSTSTASATSTPTTVVMLTCKQPGSFFRVSSSYTDGTTRYMNVVSSANMVAWQTVSAPSATGSTYTWTLDSNGYLQLAYPIGTATQVAVPYIDLSVKTSSVQIKTQSKSVVDAAVAAGTYARLKGCVNAATNEVTITGSGRSNILTCGNAFYLSTGTGSDIRSDCVQFFPTGTQV
ncbi:hypothetical protein CONLIGDRAFT_646994 [Coniochaeta ligniaria NRRL 30616]|uniref:Uncharacterized protein n=1 Tax=Coniochaeta ligniaria NRRL 30616 TaxID=1408157 RepID=A0A1J7IHW2_9PEZI|nr:hypothetical protein CONLIGDRAFT_646994 [Coniochaeta ligniaria NRRL 30616]